MKLNFISYTKHLHVTAGTNDINSNNNCYTAKSETQLFYRLVLSFTHCQGKPP